MIRAADALCLPAAQLTADEVRAADVLERALEHHVIAHMSRAGCTAPFETRDERRPAIIAEVTQRLRKEGWIPQWEMLVEQGRFSNNQIVVGWRLAGLGPTDEAYRQADAIRASA